MGTFLAFQVNLQTIGFHVDRSADFISQDEKEINDRDDKNNSRSEQGRKIKVISGG